MKLHWASLVAVVLPVLGFAGSVVAVELQLRGARHVDLAITGYDPRDMLRGHYLEYRVVTHSAEPGARGQDEPVGFGENVCVAREAQAFRLLRYNGATPASCEAPFSLSFAMSPHRIYIEQDRGQALEDAVRAGRARVRVALASSEGILVRQLLVDGRPWQDVTFANE